MENNQNKSTNSNSWSDIIKNALQPIPIHELAAIWITDNPPVVYCSETESIRKKCRIIPGDMLLIKNGKIENVVDYATHEVITCMGTHCSHLHFIIKDTVSGKITTIFI